jgi:two-component system response regulator HydG
VTGLTAEALGKLLAYRWPGNVRELENCIERAVAMTRTERLVVDDLPDRIRAYQPEWSQTPVDTVASIVTMEQIEHRYIARVLSLVGGNKSVAARLLGYDRRTLHRKLGRAGA